MYFIHSIAGKEEILLKYQRCLDLIDASDTKLVNIYLPRAVKWVYKMPPRDNESYSYQSHVQRRE